MPGIDVNHLRYLDARIILVENEIRPQQLIGTVIVIVGKVTME